MFKKNLKKLFVLSIVETDPRLWYLPKKPLMNARKVDEKMSMCMLLSYATKPISHHRGWVT